MALPFKGLRPPGVRPQTDVQIREWTEEKTRLGKGWRVMGAHTLVSWALLYPFKDTITFTELQLSVVKVV